ncbi:MAG: hypothetical protein IJY04_03550 [Clostridia bacterium]|nr:hypothetical protein [Clostridia bacterium]
MGINRAQGPAKGTKEYYERNYMIGRHELLLVILLTIISVVMIITSDSYYAISIIYSLEMLYFGYLYISGNYVGMEGAEELAAEYTAEEIMISGYIDVFLGIVPLVLLLLCWIFSKKHYAWLIVATVAMAIDTLYSLTNFDVISIIFHAIVLYYLIQGVIAGKKLKEMRDYEAAYGAMPGYEYAPNYGYQNQPIDPNQQNNGYGQTPYAQNNGYPQDQGYAQNDGYAQQPQYEAAPVETNADSEANSDSNERVSAENDSVQPKDGE